MSPLLLYSTQSYLSFHINQRFYREEHFVWCAPVYEPPGGLGYIVPPTSCPRDIAKDLLNAVILSDRHNKKIEALRTGIRRGASIKCAADVISAEQEATINAMVDQAELKWFRPLLYVIPLAACEPLVKDVPVQDRANPLSDEFTIERLHRSMFDVIRIGEELV